MQDDTFIGGLPYSLAHDGWWLDTDTSGGPDVAGPGRGGPGWGAAVAGRPHAQWPRNAGLAALVALADVLFWGHPFGVSLALFAGAIFAIATLGPGLDRRHVRPAALLAIGVLPVVEHVQALSVMFLAIALALALVWARQPEGGAGGLAAGALRVIGRVPVAGLAAVAAMAKLGLRAASGTNPMEQGGPVRSVLRNWAFPLGGTLVFAALLIDANPVLAQLFELDIDPGRLMWRGLFWCGAGLLLWPLLDPATDTRPIDTMQVSLPFSLGVNAGSTLRALGMFNALIGVQTALDASILLGHATLPGGMTLAAYAHRGAYPLLATALLAGAFALVARPYLAERRALKPLMLLWLGQNVLLSLSALLRLDLYVDSFGLTYLRLYAMIWMGLVAAGLALTAWQVWRMRSNGWLILRCGVMGVATLYACAFVNFAQIIARQNILRGHPDWTYVCALGPMASGPIRSAMHLQAEETHMPSWLACGVPLPQARGWRDWGFRTWRVSRYR